MLTDTELIVVFIIVIALIIMIMGFAIFNMIPGL